MSEATAAAGAAGPSFEGCYAANAGRLAAQLYLVVGDAEEAADCVQEAFARAWSRWPKVSDHRSDPAAWVYTAAYRIAVSRWRSRQAQRRALHRAGPPPQVPEPSADVVAVREALAGLPTGQRAALVLHYFEGLPVDEVAQVLGISESGAKSRLARGRQALAPLLRDREGSRHE